MKLSAIVGIVVIFCAFCAVLAQDGYIGAEVENCERGVIVKLPVSGSFRTGDRIEKIDGRKATAEGIKLLKPGVEVKVEFRHQTGPEKWGNTVKQKSIITTREESLLAATTIVDGVRFVRGDNVELRLKDELQLIVKGNLDNAKEIQIGSKITEALMGVRGSSGKVIGMIVDDEMRDALAAAKGYTIHTTKLDAIVVEFTDKDLTAVMVALDLSKKP